MPVNGQVTITYQTASIVTMYNANAETITYDNMVRKALTAVGSCALSDYGSVSGSYVDDSGQKTCYMYNTGTAQKC